jgi:dipeptidyl aminopeptidase/acylaminoacyl peptidase
MIRILFFLVFVSSLGMSASLRAQQPPIIDRATLFDNPEIAGGQISPDGKWMSFLKTHKGVMNIWVKPLEAPFEKAVPVTADTTRPIRGYFWTWDSRYILYVQDKGGNEDFHIYALNPQAKAGADGVPESRNLTPYDKARAFIYSVSRKDPDLLMVGLNDRDAAWHDLYQISISSGQRTLVRQNDDRIGGWYFDWDEQLRFASKTRDDGFNEILRLDGDAWTKIYEVDPLEAAGILSFTPDNKQLYLTTNKGRNFTELVLFDPITLQETRVDSDPEGRVDLGTASFNANSRLLEYTQYEDERERIYFKNPKLEAEYRFLQKQFPGKEVSMGSGDKDERLALVSVYSDDDPGAVYLFDRKTRKVTLQYRPRPKLDPSQLSSMQAISYPSSDGLMIPAFLTLPKGLKPSKLPLVVLPHGGPWARDYWGYDGYAQFLANRGYVVLQPNFRSSTGYGKAFLDAGNGQWGDLMQDDITWGVKYLVDQGYADPERVGIMGASYGGYATLAGVTFTPDLYKAGVAIVAPSNMNTLLASIPPYWESIRKFFYLRMGDPTTPEGLAQLERQSPLNHVSAIRTPLMVVQGANDPRVKKAEADQIIVAMRENKIPVSYILAPDEGHGFARPVNNMAFLAAAEKFLAQHLGGRYQADMPDDVAQRLQEITVDINTVERPMSAAELAALAATAAEVKPMLPLPKGDYQFEASINIAGQVIPLQVARSVAQNDAGEWVIKENSNSMMGQISDEIVLTAEQQWKSRKISQGPVKMDMEVGAESVAVNIDMNGQKQEVAVPVEKTFAPDGAGFDMWLASLNLKPGARFFFRIVDAQTMQPRDMEGEATGMETLTIGSKTYETLVVKTKVAADGTNPATYWLANGFALKSEATLTQMSGAKYEVVWKNE